MKLGYACINMQLSSGSKKSRITTNRTMIRRTFDQKGLPYVSEIVLSNVKDLNKILKWNFDNDIYFYRMSSSSFPWASEYELDSLPDYEEICHHLKTAGDFAKENDIRMTYHPGPFNKLCSPNERVVLNTIKDLNHHAEVMDLMGLSNTTYNKINIHVGAAYDDKVGTAKTFCKNYRRLSESCQSRLTVENDDKESLFSVKELYNNIYSNILIPIVFDYHHYSLHPGDMNEKESLELSLSTWGGIKPVVHYSQSRSVEHNNPKIKPQAHSDSYWTAPNTYGYSFDMMLECKHKEIGLYKMRELMSNTNIL